jgi:PEP-CTERM motif
MRKFALMTLTAGVLATVSIPASAGTVVEDFSFFIPAGSSSDANYLSTTFGGFDPSLGTLTGATISVTGSPEWTPGPPPGHLPPADTLHVDLLSPILASQMFASPGDTVTVDINLNGASSAAGIGSGPQQALLSFSDTFGGTLSRGVLEGAITYTFTPAGPPVPEPSTWAMMLLGFVGVAYVGLRRSSLHQPPAA